jgi:hypothetical protein
VFYEKSEGQVLYSYYSTHIHIYTHSPNAMYKQFFFLRAGTTIIISSLTNMIETSGFFFEHKFAKGIPGGKIVSESLTILYICIYTVYVGLLSPQNQSPFSNTKSPTNAKTFFFSVYVYMY